MGIAVAFATGALKGWVDTKRAMAEKEIAAKEKEAEDQKFYQQEFFKLAGKKDASPQALELAAKKGGLEYDIATANLVNNVDSTLAYGSVTFPKFGGAKEFDKNMTSGDAQVRGITWFNTVASGLRTEEDVNKFITHLESNPNLIPTFLQEAQRATDDYNNGSQKKATNLVTGQLKSYTGARTQYGNVFKVLDRFQKNMDTSSESSAAVAQAKEMNLIDNVDFSYAIKGEDGEIVVTELPERLHQQLPRLANYAPRFGGDVNKMLAEFATVVPGDEKTPQNGYQLNKVLFTALDMMDRKYDIVLNGGGTDADRAEIGKYLSDKYKNDRYSMAQAVSLLLQPDEINENTTESRRVVTEEYINEVFEKITPFKAAEVKTQYAAGVKLQGQLANFRGGTEEAGTTGFVRLVQTFGIRIFGEGGAIDQVFGDDLKKAEGGFKKGTTVESLQAIAKSKGFFSKERGMAAAKAEAAQVALAIAMARAADPAGRLSNQDFEVQLARLGAAGFVGNTMAEVQQKLNDISVEFARDLKRVSVMNEVLTSGNRITPQRIRTLRADSLIQVALDEQYLNESMTAAVEAGKPENAIPEDFPKTNLEDGSPRRTLNGQRVEYYNGQWYREDTENKTIVPLSDEDIGILFNPPKSNTPLDNRGIY
jgi:hypothetical protein